MLINYVKLNKAMLAVCAEYNRRLQCAGAMTLCRGFVIAVGSGCTRPDSAAFNCSSASCWPAPSVCSTSLQRLVSSARALPLLPSIRSFWLVFCPDVKSTRQTTFGVLPPEFIRLHLRCRRLSKILRLARRHRPLQLELQALVQRLRRLQKACRRLARQRRLLLQLVQLPPPRRR